MVPQISVIVVVSEKITVRVGSQLSVAVTVGAVGTAPQLTVHLQEY